ncbi:MAG: TonB-dependent receptor [Segetibacter sp.]|nr:TonB-dependent receptor [Segetibacter sp.]
MKFFTLAGYKLSAYIRLKTLQVECPQLALKEVKNRKVIKRISVTLALLITAFLQISFAAPITGRVTDETGSPLSGVSVTLKGTATGASTNTDGKYTINVPDLNGTLLFSFVGYTAQEVPISGRNSIDVRMAAGANTLNDVVVVGYGRQRKVNLVGSVSSVNVDEKLTNRALPNVSTGLSGLVPGLSAVQSSGMAGNNSASLIIRGLGTVNNAGPLVVVDGMPDVDINRINMNDIETISVLKDATSASVYGSRAANGVILITTRTGKGKKPSLNFSSNSSLTTPTKGMQFMADYPRALTLHQRRAAVNTLAGNQQFRNGTIDQWMALGMVDPVAYPNTDWFDVIMRNGTFQNYNLSASGGNESSNFFASIGMKDEQGLQVNNGYKQYNARFNFDYKVRKNMNVGVRFTGNWSNYTFALAEGFTDPDPNNTAGNDMQYAIAGILPYDPKTGYFGGVQAYGEDPQAYNPYTLYVNNLNHTNRQEANTSMYYDWSPIEGLTARVDYALNYYNDFRYSAATPNQAYNFQTRSFGSRTYVGANAGISNETRTGYKTLFNARLNYIKKFSADHELSGLFVYSEEYWNDRFQSSSRNDRLNPSLTEIDAALTDIQSTGGNSSTEGLRSYIGRVNYTAFNKYLLEANFRADGSSKFLEGSRFGFFPSVAVGWRFTEEDFLKFTKNFLNSGKLRVSYGSLGNNSSVGRYEQLETLSFLPYVTGTNVQRGFVNSKIINRFLSWETSTVLNVGLDLTFLNNRLTAAIDYYDRLTTGMIRPSQMSILLTGAYNAPRTNIGDMRNRGIEGDFSWRDRIGKFQYGASLNVSYNRSTLEKWSEFIGRGSTFGNNQIFLGMPFDFVYAYETDGIAQSWQDVYNHVPQGISPGDLMRKDLNGDGRITGDDRKAYPNLQTNRPTTSFALSLNGSWKGFDLAILLQGSAGRKDFWINNYNNMNFGTQRYASTWDLWQNTWSVENRMAPWPRLGGPGSNRDESIFWLDDMSFLRFKNIQLGYTIPSKMLRRIGVNNLHIVGSAENLGTITSYRGLDPEKQGDNNNLYPINKSYSIAINLSF